MGRCGRHGLAILVTPGFTATRIRDAKKIVKYFLYGIVRWNMFMIKSYPSPSQDRVIALTIICLTASFMARLYLVPNGSKCVALE